MSKVLSVRLSDGMAARVEEIAAARGCKAPTVLKAAIESLLDGEGGPVEVAQAQAARPAVRRQEGSGVSAAEYAARMRRLDELMGRR